MNRLKIALIRPNYRAHLITPPLGLGYLAAFLKTKGYDAKIIDGLNHEYSPKQIVQRCQGIDIIGINCLSAYFREVITLSRLLKEQAKTVIIGGAHASCLPELTLSKTGADYVVIGEGELSLLQLLESLEDNRPCAGITGVMSGASTELTVRPLVEKLDALPFPDWEQIDPRTYKKAPHGGLIKSFPVAPITSSRGCTFECTFCASPFLWGKRIRFRSPENVVNEIELLIKRFKVKEIHFEDDNLTLNREHVEAICNLILTRGLRFNWACPNGVRLDALDEPLLKLMKKSGCYFLAFGIESGNQEILNQAKKRIDLKTVKTITGLARKMGIITQGFFIFGLPGETEQTINQTVEFAKKMSLDKAQFLTLDILPGSQLWKELAGNKEMRWDYASYQEAVWVPDSLDKRSLNLAPGRAFRSFFFRPRQLLYLIRYFRWSQIPFIIKRLTDFKVIPGLKYLRRSAKGV